MTFYNSTRSISFAVILLISLSSCFAVKKKCKQYLQPGSSISSVGINYCIQKTKDQRFVKNTFDLSYGGLVISETFKDRELTIKDGPAKEWFDNGDLYLEGTYKNGNKDGTWKEYHNNRLNQYGQYQEGKKEGRWVGLDSLGNKALEVHYQNDQRHGPYIEYENGEVISQVNYVNGEATDGSAHFVMPMMQSCSHINKPEEAHKCSDQRMLEHIYHNILYPPDARESDIQGQAIVRFKINTKGEVEEVKVLRGLNDSIRAECKRVVQTFPTWSPGTAAGKPIDSYFTLPINFQLIH